MHILSIYLRCHCNRIRNAKICHLVDDLLGLRGAESCSRMYLGEASLLSAVLNNAILGSLLRCIMLEKILKCIPGDKVSSIFAPQFKDTYRVAKSKDTNECTIANDASEKFASLNSDGYFALIRTHQLTVQI